MMKHFVFALLMALSTLALANDPLVPDITVTFTEPTQREDGSPLLPEDIQGYKVYITQDGAPLPTVNLPAGQTSYQMIDVSAGTYAFAVSTIAEVEGQTTAAISTTVSPDMIIIKPRAPITRVIIERCLPDGSCTQDVFK